MKLKLPVMIILHLTDEEERRDRFGSTDDGLLLAVNSCNEAGVAIAKVVIRKLSTTTTK